MKSGQKRESRQGGYDADKDRVYAVYKARSEELGEGLKIELRSYADAEPRVKLTRFYRDDKDVDPKTKKPMWKEDTDKKFPRMRIAAVQWLLQAGSELDRGFSEWEADRKKGKR